MYKVRFNLGRGKNYQKFKVSDGNDHRYINPAKESLVMINCKLRNQKGTANKIFEGANKTVCAWIDCEKLLLIPAGAMTEFLVDQAVTYNPRQVPNWVMDGQNVDGHIFDSLVTYTNKVFTPNFEIKKQ